MTLHIPDNFIEQIYPDAPDLYKKKKQVLIIENATTPSAKIVSKKYQEQKKYEGFECVVINDKSITSPNLWNTRGIELTEQTHGTPEQEFEHVAIFGIFPPNSSHLHLTKKYNSFISKLRCPVQLINIIDSPLPYESSEEISDLIISNHESFLECLEAISLNKTPDTLDYIGAICARNFSDEVVEKIQENPKLTRYAGGLTVAYAGLRDQLISSFIKDIQAGSTKLSMGHIEDFLETELQNFWCEQSLSPKIHNHLQKKIQSTWEQVHALKQSIDDSESYIQSESAYASIKLLFSRILTEVFSKKIDEMLQKDESEYLSWLENIESQHSYDTHIHKTPSAKTGNTSIVHSKNLGYTNIPQKLDAINKLHDTHFSIAISHPHYDHRSQTIVYRIFYSSSPWGKQEQKNSTADSKLKSHLHPSLTPLFNGGKYGKSITIPAKKSEFQQWTQDNNIDLSTSNKSQNTEWTSFESFQRETLQQQRAINSPSGFIRYIVQNLTQIEVNQPLDNSEDTIHLSAYLERGLKPYELEKALRDPKVDEQTKQLAIESLLHTDTKTAHNKLFNIFKDITCNKIELSKNNQKHIIQNILLTQPHKIVNHICRHPHLYGPGKGKAYFSAIIYIIADQLSLYYDQSFQQLIDNKNYYVRRVGEEIFDQLENNAIRLQKFGGKHSLFYIHRSINIKADFELDDVRTIKSLNSDGQLGFFDNSEKLLGHCTLSPDIKEHTITITTANDYNESFKEHFFQASQWLQTQCYQRLKNAPLEQQEHFIEFYRNNQDAPDFLSLAAQYLKQSGQRGFQALCIATNNNVSNELIRTYLHVSRPHTKKANTIVQRYIEGHNQIDNLQNEIIKIHNNIEAAPSDFKEKSQKQASILNEALKNIRRNFDTKEHLHDAIEAFNNIINSYNTSTKIIQNIRASAHIAILPREEQKELIETIETFLLNDNIDEIQKYDTISKKFIDANIPFYWLPKDIQISIIKDYSKLIKELKNEKIVLYEICDIPYYAEAIEEKQKISTELIETSNIESIQKSRDFFEQLGFNLSILDTKDGVKENEKHLQTLYEIPKLGNIGLYVNNAQFGLKNTYIAKKAKRKKSICPDFSTAIEASKYKIQKHLNGQSFERVHINTGGHNAFCQLIDKEIYNISKNQQKAVKITFPRGEYSPMIEYCKNKNFIITGNNGTKEKNNFRHQNVHEPIYADYNGDNKKYTEDLKFYIENEKPEKINITKEKPVKHIQNCIKQTAHKPQMSMPELPEYDGNIKKYRKELKKYLDRYDPDFIIVSQNKRNGEASQLATLFEQLNAYEARTGQASHPRVIIDACQSFGRNRLNLEKHKKHIYAYLFSAHKAAGLPSIGGYLAQSEAHHEEYNGGGVETDPYYQLAELCNIDPEIFNTHITQRLHTISKLCLSTFKELAPDTIEIMSPQNTENMIGIITIKTPGIDVKEVEKLASQYLIDINAEWYGEPDSIRLSFSPIQDDYHVAVITSRIAEIVNTLNGK